MKGAHVLCRTRAGPVGLCALVVYKDGRVDGYIRGTGMFPSSALALVCSIFAFHLCILMHSLPVLYILWAWVGFHGSVD
jgi:hypothetical protein